MTFDDATDEHLDFIILQVAAARGRTKADLLGHRDSLRQLIHDAQVAFWEKRNYWEPRLAMLQEQKAEGPMYAYGADNGLGWREEDEAELRAYYEEHLKMPGEGRPPANRLVPHAPPPLYLHPVFELVRAWWQANVRPAFAPKFRDVSGEFGWEQCNDAARLLHLIVEHCDLNYDLKNTANLANKLVR